MVSPPLLLALCIGEFALLSTILCCGGKHYVALQRCNVILSRRFLAFARYTLGGKILFRILWKFDKEMYLFDYKHKSNVLIQKDDAFFLFECKEEMISSD